MSRRYEWIVVLFAAIIFLSGIISPPSLMDDVDASQALIARNMLQSGDWVTARLDGVAFLEKAPLKYWITAIFYSVILESVTGLPEFPVRFLPSRFAG